MLSRRRRSKRTGMNFPIGGSGYIRIVPNARFPDEIVHTDWAYPVNAYNTRPYPTDGEICLQNPCSFQWVKYTFGGTVIGYEVEILNVDTNTSNLYSVTYNWFYPTFTLPAANLAWRVRPIRSGSSTIIWSDYRYFSMAANASTFVVPDETFLTTTITGLTRPRCVPKITGDTWVNYTNTNRSSYVTEAQSEVSAYLSTPVVTDAEIPNGTAARTIQLRIEGEAQHAKKCAALYLLTSNTAYLTEAVLRANGLAALDYVTGSTRYAGQDQACRDIAYALTIIYDLLYNYLDGTAKSNYLTVVEGRMTDMYNDLYANRVIEQYPIDSHNNTLIGFIAMISVVMLGTISAATTWFNDSFRFYIHHISPYGNPQEGGYNNGTAYGEFTITYYLQLLDIIQNVTSINIYDKQYLKGFMKFFAAFCPPQSPSGVFGDGLEQGHFFPNLAGLSERVKTNEAKWYNNNVVDYKEPPYTYLLAPVIQNTSANPELVVNSYLFRDIGWAGMHSNLKNPTNRVSLYFRSSEFGSYNHAHGDQNNFVLTVNNINLIYNSGYYDYYGSNHWKQWYQLTKASNCITYDGGTGQFFGYTTNSEINQSLTDNGKITNFSDFGDVCYVEGDATASYSGNLTKAIRKMWFIRSKKWIVIYDDLASASAKTFEWNFHCRNDFTPEVNGDMKIIRDGEYVWIKKISPSSTTFEKTNGYPVAPDLADMNLIQDSYHVRIKNSSPVTQTKFIHVLVVNSDYIPPVSYTDNVKIQVGNYELML